jgi:hypothetical protein
MGVLVSESSSDAPVEAAQSTDRERPANAAKKALAQPPLSGAELRERLLVSSPKLVKELYDIAVRQIAEENARQTRLDSKATSLLTAAGLSLTVAFTFGGQLVAAHHKQGNEHIDFPVWGVIAFGVALLAGLGAAFQAMRALVVGGGYRAISEREVFNGDLLTYAEGHYHPEEKEKASPSDEEAATEYRKAMIPHFWEIAQEHLNVHQRKASIIRWGQGAFLLFIVAIVVVCLALLKVAIF